jgi:hypothetical protein
MRYAIRMFGVTLAAMAALVLVIGIAQAERKLARTKQGQTTGTQEVVSLHERVIEVSEEDRQLPTPPRPARSWNLEQIGFHDLGGGGSNADVWAHGDYAYVGSWGNSCPAFSRGTKVIDISDPANPVAVNRLPTERRTNVNDVKVAHIETAFFQGDLLVVSNEDCWTTRGARGIEIWDVTDPPNAEFLGSFGPREIPPGPRPRPPFEWGGGVHNLYLYQKGDRAFVLLATARAEVRQIEFDPPATGEFKIVEITNPREPVQIASWGVKQDLGEPVGNADNGRGDDCRPTCRGEDGAVIFLHDVWANREGTVAYLSYWDAGAILLDISDPSRPFFLGRGTSDLSEEGNTHSAVPAQGGNLVIVGDEDFGKDPFGFMRIFDTTDPRGPVEVGQFHTEHTFGDPPDAGWYSIHNSFVRGATVYNAWYSDGIRLVDISAPAAPREIASFVPPDVADPRGNLPAKPLVWGIYVHGDLILASDINAGLYILKRRRINISPGHPGNRLEVGSQETVVVAILGTAEFDVTQIDVASLAFGPDGAGSVAGTPEDPFPRVEDVNGDGFDDLVVLFEVEETGIALGDTEVCVTGETVAGVPLAECDSLEVVKATRGARR